MKNYTCLLLFLFVLTALSAQNNQEIWSKVSKKDASVGKKMLRKTEPIKSVYYQLDISKLKNILNRVSNNTTKGKISNEIISFPNSAGGFDDF